MQLKIFFKSFSSFFQLGLAICLLFLASCESPSAFEENQTLDQSGWLYKDTLSFKADIKEANIPYNVFVNIRHSSEYPNANLWLKIETIFPDGTKQLSPVNIPMADPTGKWYGQGFGSILSNEIKIQEKALFKETGIYEFKIIQDMRVNPVTELIDIGLKIEKVEINE